MARASIQQRFDCDEETFWRVLFFAEDFNRKLFLEHLKFDGWELTQYDETDAAIEREITVKPVTGPLPGPIKKLVGDNLGYRERGRYDKKTGRYRFTIVPNILPEKVDISGEIHLEVPEEGKVDRILELDVDCKVFGIGKLVEKRIIEDTKKSYDDSYGCMKEELAAQSISTTTCSR